MGLFKRWRAKKAAKKQLKAEALRKEQPVEEKFVVQQEKVEVKPVEKKVVEDKTQEPKPIEKKPVETKPVENKVEEKAIDTPNKPVDTKDSFKYHVSQNKDKTSAYFKQWRVRKSGSQKTIKYFDTQKEAIDYAEDLAEKAGTTIVIHKLDGSIRKQNY